MYFNENKENTNIDDQFNNKKKGFDFQKYKLPLIVLGAIILMIIVILIFVSIFKNRVNYFLILNGSEEMTIYEGTTYNEPGYAGSDNKQNDLTSEVSVSGEVNSSTIGTYVLTYKLHNTEKTRTVNVVAKPDIITIIHLKGEKTIRIKVGETFNDPGCSVIDAIEGDITARVTKSSNVDSSKAGTYRIVYSVVNSSGVTTSETRTVIVE